MIYLKLTIAFFLAALPFFYAHYVRPKTRESSKWNNLLAVIKTYIPQLKIIKDATVHLIGKFSDGMKKSDNFRKFFTLVTLLFILTFQFVDFHASHAAAAKIQQAIADGSATPNLVQTFIAFVSKPTATLAATFICFSLFWFRAADTVLTTLHNCQKLFFFVALLTLILLFMSPAFLVLTETMEVVLMAATLYPNKVGQQDPKGRKHLPLEEEQRQLEIAA